MSFQTLLPNMSVTETILLLPDVDPTGYEQSDITTTETTSLAIPKYPQTLMEKMKAKYNGGERDPAEVRRASHGCTLYFIFIAVSELYLMTLRVLPVRYPGAEEMVYYLQLLCWFVFIQAMANITCVICYNTTYQLTKDNTTSKKSLWDDDEVRTSAPPLSAQLITGIILYHRYIYHTYF